MKADMNNIQLLILTALMNKKYFYKIRILYNLAEQYNIIYINLDGLNE